MSSNKPFFTVVIYLNNESAEVTFDSIIGDKAYTDGDVQIIMVRRICNRGKGICSRNEECAGQIRFLHAVRCSIQEQCACICKDIS